MAKPLPSLSALRAISAVVRYGSVSRAAHGLCLTPGAVSRAIIEVENDLGFSLFHRAHRQVTPTALARELADQIDDGLGSIAGAFDRARSQNLRVRPLVLSCEPTFLIRWLIPRLGDLQTALGDEHDLRFVSAGGAVDFVRDGIDLAIRRADFSIGQAVHAESFLAERVGPVASPSISAVFDTAKMTCARLHAATRPNAWPDWSARTGVVVTATRDVQFEHFYQSLQAAVAGAGVAIGPIALVADDLAAGSLTAPYEFLPDGSDYVLMMDRRHGDSIAFTTMHDWLIEALEGLKSLTI